MKKLEKILSETLHSTKSQFQEDMIAPCGLNCTICHEALRKESPCGGCLGSDQQKSEYCATICKIRTCQVRKTLTERFCDSCSQYPCGEIIEKEDWYAKNYPVVESLMGNLAFIRNEGMEKFLQREQERWRCHKCDGIMCVHTGSCSNCGEEYEVK